MGIFFGALFFITVGLVALVALIQRKAAPETEPYHPLFAEAPDHPSDCGDACCWEIRLTEMHDDFDWEAREHEMRSKR